MPQGLKCQQQQQRKLIPFKKNLFFLSSHINMYVHIISTTKRSYPQGSKVIPGISKKIQQ